MVTKMTNGWPEKGGSFISQLSNLRGRREINGQSAKQRTSIPVFQNFRSNFISFKIKKTASLPSVDSLSCLHAFDAHVCTPSVHAMSAFFAPLQ